MRAHRSLAILICFVTHVAVGQEDPRFSDEAARAVRTRRQQIEAELQGISNHPWAGQYHCSGVFDTHTMALAPRSGYAYEWHGCVGVYNRNFGDVAFTNGMIRLSFTFENKKQGFQHLAEGFTPIAWGPRNYLVASDDIIGFCNEVNSGAQPDNGSFGFYLIRTGDEKKKVVGRPAVPANFRDYLLAEPIEAKIVSVGSYTTRPSVCEWKFKDTPVTLDAGKDSGLLEGMELHVFDPPDLVKTVTVTKVGKEKSEGVMVGIGEDDLGPNEGWVLSTSGRTKPGEHTTR